MILEQLFGKKKLTDSEKQITDFIESNPRIVINLTLEEFSENAMFPRLPSSGCAKSWEPGDSLTSRSGWPLPSMTLSSTTSISM